MTSIGVCLQATPQQNLSRRFKVLVLTSQETSIPVIYPTNLTLSGQLGHGGKTMETSSSRFKCQDLYVIDFFISGPASHSICQTDATITSATLDIEPRRLTLIIPGLYVLDIDLNLSDSALERALFPIGTSTQEIEHALMLKRGRNFDVDGARAEWRMKGRCLVIVA